LIVKFYYVNSNFIMMQIIKNLLCFTTPYWSAWHVLWLIVQSGIFPYRDSYSRMIYTILIGSCAFISVVKTSCFMWLYTKKFCCNFKPYHKNKQTNIHILIITKEFEIITQTSKSKWELKRGKSCNFLQKFLILII